GTYGDVYAGTLDPEQIKVAVKVVRYGDKSALPVLKCILREVHTWSKPHHNHIQPFLGITTDFDMTMSIVTLWVEKGHAHEYVQDRAIDPRPLILGIVKGLHYLHNHTSGPMVHGDVRGANVVISDDGRALLHDFSCSRSRDSSFSLSVSGPYDGALRWMAPEKLDTNASAGSDVWAFGMTALELFVREVPFHDVGGYRDILLRILQGPPDQPSDEETCSRMTKQWWDMYLVCWNRNPSLRPTMSYLVKKIEKMVRPLMCLLLVFDQFMQMNSGPTTHVSRHLVLGYNMCTTFPRMSPQ
ncbi:kinase-like domain-containing protein, partial [Scleroderma citrinum]